MTLTFPLLFGNLLHPMTGQTYFFAPRYLHSITRCFWEHETKRNIAKAIVSVFISTGVLLLASCGTIQPQQTSIPRGPAYVELTDHEKFLSDLFYEEYRGKLLWTKLRFWETDTKYPWAVAFPGFPESVWVIAYPEATYDFLSKFESMTLLEKSSVASEYGEKAQKRYVIPAPREYRDMLFNMKRGTPIKVYGDADQLKQVLVALLDNALKYTP